MVAMTLADLDRYVARNSWVQPLRLTAACSAEPISEPWQFLPLLSVARVYLCTPLVMTAGYSSARVNGTASVVRLPMYFHLPDGAEGDVAAGPGEFPRRCGDGVAGPGLLSTRISATAATITPAVVMASVADRRLLRVRAARSFPLALLPRRGARGCSVTVLPAERRP